jgi:hypothetical protein
MARLFRKVNSEFPRAATLIADAAAPTGHRRVLWLMVDPKLDRRCSTLGSEGRYLMPVITPKRMISASC